MTLPLFTPPALLDRQHALVIALRNMETMLDEREGEGVPIGWHTILMYVALRNAARECKSEM